MYKMLFTELLKGKGEVCRPECRTEVCAVHFNTWHNSIPRYVMLSLSWRFNVNPKKKNK
jgi:hypothetical protein